MSETFLSNLMRVAYEIIKADRAFIVDPRLTVLGTINIQPENIEATYLKAMKQVIESKKPLITDSVTLAIPPSQAPKTNQSFPQLRAVVFIPVDGHGAVCLDWKLRTADLLTRQNLNRLMTASAQLVEQGRTNVSEDEILQLYKELQQQDAD